MFGWIDTNQGRLQELALGGVPSSPFPSFLSLSLLLSPISSPPLPFPLEVESLLKTDMGSMERLKTNLVHCEKASGGSHFQKYSEVHVLQ